MTYEERKKWLCQQCNQKTDCAYVNRNLEYKCLLVEERLEGWELGWKDAIEKTIRWLEDRMWVMGVDDEPYVCDSEASDVNEFIKDFKKAMEE